MSGLDAIDLFAGGGGSSTGLAAAGWTVRVAANHWDVAVATHQANHPHTEHRLADLADTDWRTYPSTRLLWASPSCTWHAPAGGRRALPVADEVARTDAGAIDRATAFAVVQAAEVHRFPVVIVENVPEFRNWVLYSWWLAGLHALGYTTTELVLDAADFGHAQHRRRLFVVATQPGIDIDLTPPAPARVPASTILEADPGKRVTRRLYVADQIDQIRTPGVPYLVTYRRNARARRADRHQLATVTAGGNHHGIATRDHDGQAWFRMLTNRECARAQGFPDSYRFAGNRQDVKRQIGNAVPVHVAAWLGERAAAALTTNTPDTALAA